MLKKLPPSFWYVIVTLFVIMEIYNLFTGKYRDLVTSLLIVAVPAGILGVIHLVQKNKNR